MEVIELQCIGKQGNKDYCEDNYVFNDHYACVVDGATNVSGRLIGGQSPGRAASSIIAGVIAELPPDADLHFILAAINEKLMNYCRQFSIYDKLKEEPYLAPSAAMILYSRFHRKIWMIGDCHCLVDSVYYENTKVIDEITANARSMFLETELLSGKSIEQLMERDTGFEFILPLLRKQYFLQNKVGGNQYGFDTINGSSLVEERIKTIDVAANTEYIVFASDGYPRLESSLSETEAALAYILQYDPLCFRIYKSAKGLVKGNVSFDDRTYLKFRLK